MKSCVLSKTVVSLMMTCAAALVSSPARAQPSPVVVTFTGYMRDLSCTPSVNNNNLVELPPISYSEIPHVGDTAGDTYFRVRVDCDDLFTSFMKSKVKAYFYADHIGEGRLNLTEGTGSGWQYQLLSANGGLYQLDVLGNPFPTDDNALDPGTDMQIDSKFFEIEYIVRYYRSKKDGFRPGTGISSVNVVLYWP